MDSLDDITIERADPGDADVRPLIAAHMAHSFESAPQSSNHAMDIQALKGSGIRFWTLSDSTGVLGCGALKPLPDGTAEVKSVHIVQAARGRGLARRLMMHLIETAHRKGTRALVLETGSMEDYKPARGLYTALGFTCCDPIPGYAPDPNSVFLRLALDPAERSPQ